jgi:hypothetical protein
MTALAHTTMDSRRMSVRQRVALFAPLALLVAAAVFTNAGGRVAPDANAANSVTVTATVVSDRHITSTCGTAGTDGTIAFGSTNAATAYENNATPCSIVFGSTNSAANLQVNAAATNLSWAGYGAKAAACGAPAAGTIGIRADSSSTATLTAPYNCADGATYAIPTAAATFCSVVAGADKACDIVVGFNTGAVAAGAKSGVLTTTLT